MKRLNQCRICKSPRLVKYLDLGSVPLCNRLIEQNSPPTEKFPIEVLLCEDCLLSQLSVVVDPAVLYTDYVYHSSVSQTFKSHCFELGKRLLEMNGTEHPLVIDIASNDGCLLKEFKRAGFQRLMGFDPAFKLDYSHAAPEPPSMEYIQLNHFWSEETIRRVFGNNSGGTQGASFITAQNVFGHVDDLDDFLRGVHYALDDRGIFVVEVPYLPELFRQNAFDTIYHEHLSYFLLSPLIELFSRNGLPIFKSERISIHGGSIRIYASKNAYSHDQSVDDLLLFEDVNRFHDLSTYLNFASQVDGIRGNMHSEIQTLFNQQYKVAAYGASAKGISLLNYCSIGIPWIDRIVDDTPAKQHKMTPGSHIQIDDFSYFEKAKPDYILLLAWNFADELIAKTKHLGARYIVPIPYFKVID